MNLGRSRVIKTIGVAALSALLPLSASAATLASSKSAKAKAAQVTQAAQSDQTRVASLQTRAEAEIDRRVNMLNNLTSRLSNTNKLTAGNKTALAQAAQTEITNLTALKAKIAADTDLATLKSDVQSIPAEYAAFKLIVPKVWLIAASDSILRAVDRLTTLSTALQARVTQAQQGGQDVTQLNSQLQDITAKITAAKTAVNSVETAVTALTADQVKGNPQSLSGYRDQLQAAVQQLQQARNEASAIITQLKAAEAAKSSSTNSTSSTSTTPDSTAPAPTPPKP